MTKKTKVTIQTEEPGRKGLRVAGITVLAAAAAGAALVLIVRDQMTRHRRDLFSPNVLERLAALGYMAKRQASVDTIMLLRDFIAWEPRRLLRARARQIVARMEADAAEPRGAAAERAG